MWSVTPWLQSERRDLAHAPPWLTAREIKGGLDGRQWVPGPWVHMGTGGSIPECLFCHIISFNDDLLQASMQESGTGLLMYLIHDSRVQHVHFQKDF